MEVYLTTIGIIGAALAAIAVVMIRENCKRRKSFLAMLRRQYGACAEREYRPGEMERISHYFKRKQGVGFQIDDITWNDLDMDRVYAMVNRTVSSPGDDYLYDRMRTPGFSEEELREQERLVTFFQSHPREREKLQLILLEVGRSRYGSLADVVFTIHEAPFISPVPHIIGDVLLAGSLAFMLAAPVPGLLASVFFMFYNVVTYYTGKERKNIELYLSCFNSLVGMLQAAKKMETLEWPQIKTRIEAIKEGRKAFGSFSQRAFFLGTSSATDSNPLQAILDYLRIVFHIDILVYNSLLRTAQKQEKAVFLLLDNMGALDASIAIGSFRKFLPYWSSPVLDKEETGIQMKDLYHPLIENPVANSLDMKGPVLLTGSNASGKSTFLKTVAVNAILAQTLGTCTASYYQAPYVKILTSMALKDNLQGGESYFIVEIKSLKRILDESRKGEPLLCIVDEVLRGTNTIERVAASSGILRYLKREGVFCMAATHDLELTHILSKEYENYHFEEEVGEKEVTFSYQLKKGRADTRNAIRLLELMDYPKTVVERAEASAKEFERTGIWRES